MKKRVISLILAIVLCLALIPAAAAAEGEPIVPARPVTDADLAPMEVAHINSENMGPDIITVGDKTYYVGPSAWSGEDPQFQRGMFPSWDAVEDMWVKIGIWTRGEGRDAPFAPVTGEELTTLLEGADLHLHLYALNKQGYYPAILAQETVYPYTTTYRFTNQNGNQWVCAVSGTIQGQEVLGTGFNDYRPQKETRVEATSIADANEKIAEAQVKPGWRYVVQLPSGDLGEGTLVIPENKDVVIAGGWDANHPTIIHGGVHAEGDVMLQDLHFIGKGKDVKEDNNGFYGEKASSGGYTGCTFEGFYIAISAEEEAMRFGGANVVLKNNHIGYQMDVDDADGLNPEIHRFRFEGNDIAMLFEDMSDYVAGWVYKLYGCSFINNKTDIVNQSDRYLFFPDNYFTHENELEAETEGKVSVYPMAADQDFRAEDHGLLHEAKSATLGNQLTAQYPIPANQLDGKQLTIVDSTDTGDKTLAQMVFPEAKAPKVRMRRAAEAPKTFDATVEVERTADTITFTMQNPQGKNPEISIPCTWTEVEVRHGDTVVESKADGQNVMFPATEGGTYVISNEESPAEPVLPINPVQPEQPQQIGFSDVNRSDWYYDAVQTVTEQGLMKGVSETSFAPNDQASRAMILTMLARLEKADLTGGETWYEKAVAWAVTQGISDGTAQESAITRQQLVTMLWRFAGSPKAEGSLARFRDADQVAAYAESAMIWAVSSGIISGMGDNTLNPNGTATRAQIAQIFCNYLKLVG